MVADSDSSPATGLAALPRFINFVESLVLDPSAPALSPEVTVRLRRFLIRVANGSSPAIRLAERFERNEIDGDNLLEMIG
jgi:hypothetical protein